MVALAAFIGIGSGTAAVAAESVEFRLPTWKTMHFYDGQR
jgi:hypothetical protein